MIKLQKTVINKFTSGADASVLCTVYYYTHIHELSKIPWPDFIVSTKIWACACAPRHNYTRSQSSGCSFNGYHPVRGSLVALASSSAIVNSYSRSINEIASCKVIDCEQVCLRRSLWRSIGTR